MAQELTYKWIQERLRELNAGTLSEQDRQRLTSLAKDDPFVADALEGFDVHADTSHDVYLEAIRHKISHQKRDRRRWLMPNLAVTAIAASALIIIATFAVISRLQKESEQEIIVMVTPDSLAHADTTSAIVTAEEPVPEKLETSAPAAPGAAAKEKMAVTSREEKDVPPGSSEGLASGTMARTDARAFDGVPVTTPSAERKVEPTIVLDDATKEDIVISEPAPPTSILAGSEKAKRDEGFYANQLDASVMTRRLTGQIISRQSGLPVPEAKIAVSYSNQLYYPDAQGQFEINLTEPQAIMAITYPGVADTALIVEGGADHLQISLNTEASLQNNIARQQPAAKGPVYPSRNPAIEAFNIFRQYLHTSSLLQLTTEPGYARRKVSLSFKVKSNGQPADITILESSRDKTYDEEAVRLIKEGPDWYCPGGVFPCERIYTIYFR